MAQEKLWNRREILKVAAVLPMLAWIGAHAGPHRRLVGLTFVFESIASDIEIRWLRMQGASNEREAGIFVTRASAKEFAYLPGDVAGVPDWMEVEWLYALSDVPGVSNEQSRSAARSATARFDLTAIIPQSAIEEAWRDRERKQIKLIFVFNDAKLDLRYEIYQWHQ